MEIILTNGLKTTISDCDYELVSKFKWRARQSGNTFYAVATYKGRTIRMHRLIMGATDPNVKIDHRDNNGLNNTRENLRECTQAQNNRNRIARSVTGLKGVYPTKSGKFRAKIFHNGKRIGLGTHETKETASIAYSKASAKYHKDFGCAKPAILEN